MKRAYFIAAVCAALSAALSAAPTANEDFVIAEAAAAYSNAVYTAGTNTAAAIAAAEPDFSTGNTQLVATIEATAPMPGNYATVSNKAMTALQSYTETDPRFSAWADAHVVAGGSMVDWAIDALYAQKLGGGFFTNYSADDITAISNGFSAADESLSSRLSLASLAATNYTDSAIGAAIANTNPTFSNAVLSVGLNIDTNTVAAINALVEAGDELPIGGAATVGGLLLALAAAVAALKRTKADASALRYAFAATIQPTAGTAAPTGTLTDRAENKVVCTEATGQTDANAKLTLTLPPAVPGYVRDFLVKIDRTTSGCYSVDFVPYGDESVSYETEDGSMPEVPDGKVTWLSFTESESGGVFAVRATPLVAVTGGV